MQTHAKKRIEIVVESPLMARVIAILDEAGVGGYTVVPALAGRGKDGAWHRDGIVGRVGTMVMIFTIVDPAKVDALMEPLFTLVSRQIGVVTVSDVHVVRPEQF
jgi:PII-like signaling protein